MGVVGSGYHLFLGKCHSVEGLGKAHRVGETGKQVGTLNQSFELDVQFIPKTAILRQNEKQIPREYDLMGFG